MANYFIIGGDGKEYGPVTEADLRQWIAEERLNAQSLAKAESDAEFRPLATFPELAALFNQAPASGTPPVQSVGATDDGHAAALQKIKPAALGLKIVAIINLVLSLWSLVQMLFFPPDLEALNSELKTLNNPQMTEFVQKMLHISNGPLGIANVVLGMTMSILIFMGASKMQSLRSYEFAFTAAVLSVIPCLTPCCGFVIGLAFGIWALWLLTRPEIKSKFK